MACPKGTHLEEFADNLFCYCGYEDAGGVVESASYFLNTDRILKSFSA